METEDTANSRDVSVHGHEGSTRAKRGPGDTSVEVTQHHSLTNKWGRDTSIHACQVPCRPLAASDGAVRLYFNSPPCGWASCRAGPRGMAPTMRPSAAGWRQSRLIAGQRFASLRRNARRAQICWPPRPPLHYCNPAAWRVGELLGKLGRSWAGTEAAGSIRGGCDARGQVADHPAHCLPVKRSGKRRGSGRQASGTAWLTSSRVSGPRPLWSASVLGAAQMPADEAWAGGQTHGWRRAAVVLGPGCDDLL